MKEINYWERFLTTGSVQDFLSYRNALEEEEQDGRKDSVGENRSGGRSHAGIYRDYGNDFKSRTDW